MINFKNISFSIGGVSLLEETSAFVPTGHKVGIVGRNGAGKTTLFKLIQKELIIDGGFIEIPRNFKVGSVAQEAPSTEETLLDTVLAADVERAELLRDSEIETDPNKIANIHIRLADIDAYSADARASSILTGLGFSQNDQKTPCSSFSGGWRMRVALASVLFSNPDLLLLDEPTNYLDFEGTAGNTGIGLGLVGNSLGYKTVIVMPETQSQEKKDALKLIGCELRLVPALPYSNPGNYIRQSEEIAKTLGETNEQGVLWANQFDNIANQMSHYNSTGPEIWEQTNGAVDAFTCAVGTGGTLSGTGLYLKEQNNNIKIALSDPYGSGLYNYYQKGEMKSEGNSITEGIGQGRVTKNLENCPIDMSFRIDDNQALTIIFELLKEEGLFLGGSSGINVAGAIKLAKELGPGHTIVTILCDSGQRYQSKIWNPSFLKSKDLAVPHWL